MSEITEQLTLIEEALESILEYRDGGMPEVFSHLKHHITHGLTRHLRDSWQRTKDRANVEQSRQALAHHSGEYNKAHADYQIHKSTGNAAGMATAKMNMAHHHGQMKSHANAIHRGGGTIDSDPTATQKKQHAEQQRKAAQKQAEMTAKKQQAAQKQAEKNRTYTDDEWKNTSNQFDAAKRAYREAKSNKAISSQDLFTKKAEYDRLKKQMTTIAKSRNAQSANEAWDLAESLILDLLEDMKNRENKAIITKKEIIKNGKPHVKGEFIRTEIIKDAKKDIPDVQREMICAKASRKAEGMGAKIRRDKSQELRKDLGI